jgi:NAD(P)-dependent dehydrogenase (short-subunit alcohol dehydrogenase family)
MIDNMLANKTILVTGASSGIGRAVSEYFSSQGARLVISGRDHERLEQTSSSLVGEGHYAICADLRTEQDISCFMDQIFEDVGSLDALVHCAGIMKTLPLQALKEKDFDDCFNTNVKSAQFLVKNFRKRNRYKDNSSVVLLSSVAATCGEPANTTYAASKAALEGLSKSLAIELAKQNIRVNCLAPGLVKTEMMLGFAKQLTKEQLEKIENKHPLGLGLPEDVAYAAGFLCSDLSKWITGTTLFVDGGYSAQ